MALPHVVGKYRRLRRGWGSARGAGGLYIGDVDRSSLRSQRRHHQRLRQRRVSVDRQVDLFEGQAVLHGQRRLGDEVRRARADDVGAQETPGVRVGDDLGETFGLAERQGAARGGEGEPT